MNSLTIEQFFFIYIFFLYYSHKNDIPTLGIGRNNRGNCGEAIGVQDSTFRLEKLRYPLLKGQMHSYY